MDYIKMGARLRLLRESKTDEMGRRFSQGKLVDEFTDNGTKMTQSKLSGLENGEIALTPDLIILYSNYFDVSTDFILKGENETFPGNNEITAPASEYDDSKLMEALQYWEIEAEKLQSSFVVQNWTTPFNFLSSAFKYYTTKGRWQEFFIWFVIVVVTVGLFQTDKGKLMVFGAGFVLYVVLVITYFIALREDSRWRYRRCIKRISDIKKELNIFEK